MIVSHNSAPFTHPPAFRPHNLLYFRVTIMHMEPLEDLTTKTKMKNPLPRWRKTRIVQQVCLAIALWKTTQSQEVTFTFIFARLLKNLPEMLNHT